MKDSMRHGQVFMKKWVKIEVKICKVTHEERQKKGE